MIKRLIFSFFLCSACVFARADVQSDLSTISGQITTLQDTFEQFLAYYADNFDQVFAGGYLPQTTQWEEIILNLRTVKNNFATLLTNLQTLSTDLLSVYYQSQLIEGNTHDSLLVVENIYNQVFGLSDLIGNLGSFLDDYGDNIQTIFDKLDRAYQQAYDHDETNKEQLEHIAQLIEDIHDLFYSEGNIRELLEAIVEQKMYVEYIYSFLDNTFANWLTHADQYFFNPFYTSYMQPWSVSFDSVRMSGFSFQPLFL